jgi:hypothetical protein
MKRKATAPNKEVDLLAIQDSFERLGHEMPSFTSKEAILKLGPAKGLTGPDGRPKSKTAQNFLKICLKAFRRGQRTAKKRPLAVETPKSLSKSKSLA